MNTLTEFDDLDGAGGTDTLNARLADDVDNTVTLTSIEVVNLRSSADASGSSGGIDVNAENFSGIEQLWSDRSNFELNVKDVQGPVIAGLNQVAAGADYNITYASDVLGSDSYTQQIVLQGAGNATASGSVDLTIAASGDDDITGLDINAASGVNHLSFFGVSGAGASEDDDIETLAIEGSAGLMINGNDFGNALESVDATGYSGDLELDISGKDGGSGGADNYGPLDVILGDGDDTLTVAAEMVGLESGAGTTTLPTDISIDGGLGANTLVVDDDSFIYSGGLSDYDFANVSNFQELSFLNNLGPGSGSDTLDLSETGFTSLTLQGMTRVGVNSSGGETDNDLTIIGSEAFNEITLKNTLNVGESGGSSGHGSITLEGFSALAMTFEEEASGSYVGGGGLIANDLVNGTVNLVGDTSVEVAALNSTSLETLTLNLGEGSGSFTGPLSADAGVSASLETVTVTGGEDTTLTFGMGVDQDSFSTLDLSGMNGGDGASGGTGTMFTIADVAQQVTIQVGTGDLEYDTLNTQRDLFQFVGDDIGYVEIGQVSESGGFDAGTGANKDRLDFSLFEGITDGNDLDIVQDGANAVITAADGQFEGTIVLVGVDADAELSASLIFA